MRSSADRPDPVWTTGGPPRPLRGPSLRDTTDAFRAPPPTMLLDQHYGCRSALDGGRPWRQGARPALRAPRGPPHALRCLAGNPHRFGCRTGPLGALRGLLAPPQLKRLDAESRCIGHSHNHLDNDSSHTRSPGKPDAKDGRVETIAETFWHTSDIPSTILIHVGSPRVHVCNVLGASWTMSWHTPDIPSTLLIHVGVPCKRV
jgi:hypothetical protein